MNKFVILSGVALLGLADRRAQVAGQLVTADHRSAREHIAKVAAEAGDDDVVAFLGVEIARLPDPCGVRQGRVLRGGLRLAGAGGRRGLRALGLRESGGREGDAREEEGTEHSFTFVM